MICVAMKQETLIQALQSKIKEKDMDIPENVHFNDGMITAIEEVKKQYLLEKLKRKQKRQQMMEGVTA
jgi:uncharacterized membrane protein